MRRAVSYEILRPAAAVIGCLWVSSGATLAQVPQASRTQDAQRWTQPSRQFVFGSIVFNVDYGMWVQGSRHERLTDCSNDRLFCLSSETFSIALPKRCGDQSIGRWAVGNVRTQLLFRHVAPTPPIHGGGSATTLYLGNPEQPRQLFVYDLNQGLRALYWADVRETDFIRMAREGRLESWLFDRANGAERQRIYFPLITFGSVGECRRAR
jgi:hypothetical protein